MRYKAYSSGNGTRLRQPLSIQDRGFLMTDSKRTLEKLSHENWELKLLVDSSVIESLKWAWTAKVSVEDGQNGSTVAIAPATHDPVGMPDGDGLGNRSYTSKLTGGINGVPVSELESVFNLWERECRQISSELDSSVMRRRRDLERRKLEEDRKAANRQNVVTYLDSLASDAPEP